MEKLELAKKNLTLFRSNLIRFIETLINSFPEEFDTENVKTMCETLNIYKDEKISVHKNGTALKRLKIFGYLLRYRYEMREHIKDLNKMDYDLFDPKKYPNFPSNILITFDINFRRIWKIRDLSEYNKKMILMYLRLLYECAEKTTSIYEVSEESKKVIENRRKVRKLQREKLRKSIYKMLGDEGRNESIDIIIEDVLDEFENSKKLFNGSNVDPNIIKDIISRLYEKLGKRYEEGDLDDIDLKNSAKALYNNILVKDEMNMKDEFKDIMKSFNLDNLDMNDPDIMDKLETVVKDNPELKERIEKIVKQKNND